MNIFRFVKIRERLNFFTNENEPNPLWKSKVRLSLLDDLLKRDTDAETTKLAIFVHLVSA